VREQLEGSQAIARAVARCRPHVVPAYPITPQTHIVEGLGKLVKAGALEHCEFITVESEFAAMSAAIGASAAGARSYTATASQGLLYMAEALFNAAGLGLPIVMTVANRAIGAPINIWNDQSDAMSQRDCGWVQLYAADNQEAVDLHPVAFALAEQISVPVMVCVDGFVLTHAFEPLELPAPEDIDAVLPTYEPRQVLDPDEPVTIGAMVGPEAYTEVRYLADQQLRSAETAFAELAGRYAARTGRRIAAVRAPAEAPARTVVVTLGSVLGTVQDVAAETDGAVGVVGLTMYRPFPAQAVREVVRGADHVIVLERAFSPGAGAPVTSDVRTALYGTSTRISTVVGGLGGRPVTRSAVREMLSAADRDELAEFSFLDLDVGVVERELSRQRSATRPGPAAASVLREVVPAGRGRETS
jgi:pyruvate ferredoxin oxidoreductase alpha subunit